MSRYLVGWAFLFCGLAVQAAVYYVDCDRPDNTGDGLSWTTAKRTIQAAIDIATDGDTIRVGPGTYGEGTTPTPGSIIRSRVVCEKAIAIESTGGAEATIILGERDPLDTSYQGTGANAVRCVYMSAGTLTGFTLTGGATHSDITENSNCRGGGLLAASSTPVLYDCIVSNNAARRGGGAYKGTFHRTRFLGNFASQNGAGVRESRLHDCLVAFNTGSAIAYCNSQSLFPVNCTIARNTGAALDCSGGYNLIITENGNAFSGTQYPVVDSCIQYATNVGSNNLVTLQAHFVDSANGDFRLLASSPCLDRGNPAWTGAAPSADQRTDLAGNPRLQGAALDLGALEGTVSGVAVVTCIAPTGNGTLTPQGHFFLPVLPTQLLFTATADAGSVLRHFSVNGYKQKDCGTTFALRIKDPGAVYIVTAEFRPARYVDPAGSDANNGTSPATAWRTLQHAATAAPSGSLVLAAPGTYNEGHAFGGSHSNRVVITRDIVLKATAGPGQTVIEGAADPDSTLYGCGTNAMRCLYISAGAVEGFTLTGGASSVSPEDKDADNVRGGAVFGAAPGTLWDCVISNNVASRGAAGFGGTFNRCLVTGNRVHNNGTFRAAEVYDCLIVNNIGNWAGVFGGRFYGCTISGQSAGGGIGESTTAYNTILFDNAVQDAAAKATCVNCCTGGQLRPGAGNIAADPLFVDAANGDFRLRADSPCINAGDATYGTGIGGADFVGAPRVQGGQVNIGAYEGAVGSIMASATSGGSIDPSGAFLLTNDVTFTATPWPGRAFRYFELNGVPVPGSATSLDIVAAEYGDGAVIVRAVFQDGFYVNAATGDDANSGLEVDQPLKTLQVAVSRTLDGDTVRVAPGTYNAGSAVVAAGALANRLVITNDITVMSLGGPEDTFIVGARSQNANGCGSDAVRCVYMSAGTLQGFTITGGATDTENGGFENDCGGGIYSLSSSSASVIDCVISNNIAYSRGGGASLGTLHRCLISENAAIGTGPTAFGGAVRGSRVYDSLIANNSGSYAIAFAYLYNVTAYNDSPVSTSSAYNSILILIGGGNSYAGSDSSRKVFRSCLSGTLPAANDGGGNLFEDPLFMNPAAGDFRLHRTSPCIDRGRIGLYGNGLGLDLLGAARLQGADVDMGAYEGGVGGVRIIASVDGGGSLEPQGTMLYPASPVEVSFTATPWPGRAFTHFSTNGVALPAAGNTLQLNLTTDQAINLVAHFAGTLYVDVARPDDSGDGLSWGAAKRTLQAAVTEAADNDTVLVAPGLYQEGAFVTPNEKATGYIMNRVVITNRITVRSRDGAAATVIQGAFDTASGDLYGRGPNAVRCAYMTKGVLQGFTLTGGATDTVNLEDENNRGGGVYVPELTYTPEILDCVITNCASVRGGGIHAGTLRRCVLRGNYAANNSAAARGSVAYDCLIVNNLTCGTIPLSAVAYGWCYNCTLANNAGRAGDFTVFYNCILTDPSVSSRHFDCCTAGGTVFPVTNDACFADAPLFVDAASGDYRLAAGSPCIDRANRAYVRDPFGADVTGDLRMQNAAVDLGAIEHDWRPALAAALDADGVTVADLTPFVTHAAQTAYLGGSAVYLDGAAARTNGQSEITMGVPWYVPYGRSATLRGEVTGNGTLVFYEGESLIATLTSGDGAFTLKHPTAAQKPFPLRIVYAVGDGDTGGAFLDAFEGSSGMLFMLK